MYTNRVEFIDSNILLSIIIPYDINHTTSKNYFEKESEKYISKNVYNEIITVFDNLKKLSLKITKFTVMELEKKKNIKIILILKDLQKKDF